MDLLRCLSKTCINVRLNHGIVSKVNISLLTKKNRIKILHERASKFPSKYLNG